MPVKIKTADEIAKMRIAGRLAAEVLDFIAPHVRPGVTTGELDRLCHDHILRVQRATPAPLEVPAKGAKKSTKKSDAAEAPAAEVETEEKN